MEKKNTILLTVIAIATLLVAVVGATFAYFSVTVTNSAAPTVKATTVTAHDVFTATGSGDIELTINNDNMMDNDGGKTSVSDSDSSLVVSLTAGSGKATCNYDLQLVQDSTGVATYAPSSNIGDEGKEFTIQGTDGKQKFEEVQINTALANTTTSNEATEKGSDGKVQGTSQTSGILGSYKIEAGTTKVTQTWTIKAIFYNLAVPQDTQMGKTFGYSVKVVNVNCTNAASK